MVSARSSLVLFSCLVLCSVEYALAMKCYHCISNQYGECNKTTLPDRFLIECGSQSLRDPNYIASLVGNNNEWNQILIQLADSGSVYNTNYQCVKFEGWRNSDKVVVRTCRPTARSCEYYSHGNQYLQLTNAACTACDSDSCNSSTAIQAGFWSLILSFAVLFYIKQ